ncbi:MAG: hypothetical protein HYW49_11815 [Deltaproteobacteria bacterium]|nr:hypothetical protein [Deltaproteobacteria bacterium]
MNKLLVLLSLVALVLVKSEPAHAFTLLCKADESIHLLAAGFTTMDCVEPKTGLTFTTEEIEIGPGFRFTPFMEDASAVAKYVAITCPFMGKKRLARMNSGDTLVIAGMVADANALVGIRLGVEVGRPGVCFITGASAFELGGELALDGLRIIKD